MKKAIIGFAAIIVSACAAHQPAQNPMAPLSVPIQEEKSRIVVIRHHW
jgi:hypothetical protein